MRIIVLTGRYAYSGVPLAQQRFAKALAARGYEVTFLIGAVNAGFSLPVVAGVDVRQLGAERVSKIIWPLIKILIAKKVDVIFSAGDHLNAVVLISAIVSFSKVLISCSSRVTPFDTYGGGVFGKGFLLKTVMRLVMWRANVLTCVAKDMVHQYHKIFPGSRHVAVYNIVRDSEALTRVHEPLADKWISESPDPLIVAAGSLVPWKGFHDLIEAFAILAPTHKVRLVILGEGNERENLQNLIRKYSLEERVHLLGNVENPLKYYAAGKVFVLSSHVEGMPNVLVEAMVAGCTPVATDCPTGPRELIQALGEHYLVPMHAPEALAEGIKFALVNPVDKDLLRKLTSEFEESYVIERHFQLLGVNSRSVLKAG